MIQDVRKQAAKWLKMDYYQTITAADKGRHPYSTQTNANSWVQWIKDNVSEAEFIERRRADPNWLCAAPIDTPGLWDQNRGFAQKTGASLTYGFWDYKVARTFIKMRSNDPALEILKDDLSDRNSKLAVFIAEEVFESLDPTPEGLVKAPTWKRIREFYSAR